MTTVRLRISKMHCTSCAMSIDLDLEDLPGVIKASTSYARAEAVVEYDETRVSLPRIIACIKASGYSAEPFPESAH